MSKYKIIAIIGEAGSGKDTILHLMPQRYYHIPVLYHEIISCTTRPPREKEIDGRDYYFYTDEEFAEKIINQEMLEAMVFNNWCYGTSLDGVEESVVNVGVFNPEGVESLLAHPDVDLLKVFYIKSRPKDRLIRQLNREENPDIDEIIRRYKADREDFMDLPFQYTILRNDNIDDVSAAADEIIKCIADSTP